MEPQVFLSEPHNFGRRVYRHAAGLIHKPRSVFWENLFLSESHFRAKLFEIASKGHVSFALPSLSFEEVSEFSGTVQELVLQPLSFLSGDQAFQIGCTSALFAWFGISDLHHENIKIGQTLKGQFIFTTVDIETVLDQFLNLGHSGLVPDIAIPQKVCGIAEVLSFFATEQAAAGSAAAICDGYLQTLNLLNLNSETLEKEFCYSLNEVKIGPPIRVVLRKTRAYTNYMSGTTNPGDFEIPPLPSELEQLQRGDIPYFFRRPAEPDSILYFEAPDRICSAELGEDFKKMRLLERRLFDAKQWQKSHSNEKLIKVGVLQLARALARAMNQTNIQSDFNMTRLGIDADRIYLQSKGSVSLTCLRS